MDYKRGRHICTQVTPGTGDHRLHLHHPWNCDLLGQGFRLASRMVQSAFPLRLLPPFWDSPLQQHLHDRGNRCRKVRKIILKSFQKISRIHAFSVKLNPRTELLQGYLSVVSQAFFFTKLKPKMLQVHRTVSASSTVVRQTLFSQGLHHTRHTHCPPT